MSSATSPRIEQTRFFFWMRIVAGSIAAIAAAVHALTDFKDVVGWTYPLLLACFFAFLRLRQPGESRREYFANPRSLFSNLAALSAVILSIFFLIRTLT